jgi:hypothetical protein
VWPTAHGASWLYGLSTAIVLVFAGNFLAVVVQSGMCASVGNLLRCSPGKALLVEGVRAASGKDLFKVGRVAAADDAAKPPVILHRHIRAGVGGWRRWLELSSKLLLRCKSPTGVSCY